MSAFGGKADIGQSFPGKQLGLTSVIGMATTAARQWYSKSAFSVGHPRTFCQIRS